MNLKDINSVYFIGIGGIGMSGLARYFLNKGIKVCGYDLVETELTKALVHEGADIHYEDNYNLISEIENIEMVVYTPAIPVENSEFAFFKTTEIPMLKRAEVLGLLTKNSCSIAVAGTHGKTTTSTIVAHILECSGLGCNAFLGGVSENYNSNIILNPNAKKIVVEADEYDRSFLKLSPNIAIITSIDPDHLDVYGTKEAMLESFQKFADLIPNDGKLIVSYGLPISSDNLITYGEEKNADLVISNISIKDGEYYFDVFYNKQFIKDLHLGLQGRHNVHNAVSAILLALELGIDESIIRKSLASFNGVKRRFEVHVKNRSVIYIDDYAHHPKELDACIGSVKELYPNKKITGIFQPHLYTRTRDFMSEFALSLSQLDEVILLDIYPAREKPLPGVDSRVLLEKINCQNKILIHKDEVVRELEDRYIEVLLTLGAGNIDELVQPIKEAIISKTVAN